MSQEEKRTKINEYGDEVATFGPPSILQRDQNPRLRPDVREGLKKKLNDIYLEYYKLLGLGWWSVDLVWMDGGVSREDGTTAADCWVAWPYRKAEIRFFLEEIQGYSDEKMRQLVLHEILHIFVNPMREGWPEQGSKGFEHCMKMEEMVVSSLERALWFSRLFDDKPVEIKDLKIVAPDNT